MKKLLAIVLVLVMMLSTASLVACNREIEDNSSGISNYAEITTFDVKDPTGKVLGTVTYKGQGTDKAIITGYTPRISGQHSIYIPDIFPGSERIVAGVAPEAFRACTSLTSVRLPDTVEYIGDWAFYLCSSLYEINVPEKVTYIGKGAFVDCKALTEVKFADEPLITSIGEYAFNGCESIVSITLPEGVETIGEGAFFNCYRLESATLPASVKAIGRTAFANCPSVKSITLGDNIEELGEYAFGTLVEDAPEVLVYTKGTTTDTTINAK